MVSRDSQLALAKVFGLLWCFYTFLVSVGLIGKSFKYLGHGVAGLILTETADPLIGLFSGVLATSLVQSSSTVTSLVVGLVGGGVLPFSSAIPIVMGANIGTSVTNTIVSLGHITRRVEFQRAFSAAVVHDFFNIMAVMVFFPLQYFTNFLAQASGILTSAFADIGGLTFVSPVKTLTAWAVDGIIWMLGDFRQLAMFLGFAMLLLSLRYIVKLLKSLVLARVERFFGRYIFKTAPRSFALGLLVTIFVQSSSVSTSLAVPLAGSGVLNLRQIFPYTMGSNIGTTVTAILASLATGSPAAVGVAIAHTFQTMTRCAWRITPPDRNQNRPGRQGGVGNPL